MPRRTPIERFAWSARDWPGVHVAACTTLDQFSEWPKQQGAATDMRVDVAGIVLMSRADSASAPKTRRKERLGGGRAKQHFRWRLIMNGFIKGLLASGGKPRQKPSSPAAGAVGAKINLEEWAFQSSLAMRSGCRQKRCGG